MLYLRNTKITDAGLKELNKLDKLTSLDLANTKITDTCVQGLTELKSLTEINVMATKITGAGVEKLQNALPSAVITRTSASR